MFYHPCLFVKLAWFLHQGGYWELGYRSKNQWLCKQHHFTPVTSAFITQKAALQSKWPSLYITILVSSVLFKKGVKNSSSVCLCWELYGALRNRHLPFNRDRQACNRCHVCLSFVRMEFNECSILSGEWVGVNAGELHIMHRRLWLYSSKPLYADTKDLRCNPVRRP